MKASSIYDSECTEKPKDYNPDQEFLMVGEPDSEKCKSIVKSIFDFKTCNSTQCSFDGVEQPPVTGDFMVTHSPNKTHARRKMKMKKKNVLYVCTVLFRHMQDSSSLPGR